MLEKKPPKSGAILTIPGVIPIEIHPLFWLVAGLISVLNAPTLFYALTIWLPIVFFSILIHEYGHALTALAFGQRARIELVAFGGLTYRTGKAPTIWQDFIIILNGPLAGILLACFAYLTLRAVSPSESPTIFYAALVTLNINIIWTFFNLLPIHPLDGGHLLRCMLQGAFGLRGVKSALFLSMLFAAGLCGLAFFFRQLLIGSIFLLFAFESFRAWRAALRLTAEDEDVQLQEELSTGEKSLEEGDIPMARTLFEDLVAKTKRGVIHLEAVERLAQLHFKEKRYLDSYALLKPHIKELSIESLGIAQLAAYYSHAFDEALKIGNKLWRDEPMPQTACFNAFSHAAKGEAAEAVGWLSSMTQNDAKLLADLVHRPEFDAIRDSAIFRSFAQQFPLP